MNYAAKMTEYGSLGRLRGPGYQPKRSNLSDPALPQGPSDLAQAPKMLIFSFDQMPPIGAAHNPTSLHRK